MPPKSTRAGNRKGRATAQKPSRQRVQERKSEFTPTVVSQVSFLRSQPATAFGQAPPSEDYPEGGMRIAGSCKMNGLSVGHLSGNNQQYGGLLDTSSRYCFAPVAMEYSPIATFANLTSVFGPGLLNIGYQFEKYRVRKLVLRYIPSCSSSTSARVTITYSRDPFAAIAQTDTQSNSYYLSPDTTDDARVSVSASAWQAMSLEVIPMRKAQRDDELFFCDYYAGTGSQYAPSMRQSIQGAIGVACVQATSDPTLAYGRIYLDFVVDLYGFNSGPISQVTSAAAAERAKAVESKGDVKSSIPFARGENSKARALDTEYELVQTKAEPTPVDRAQGRTAGSKDDTGTGWFRKA